MKTPQPLKTHDSFLRAAGQIAALLTSIVLNTAVVATAMAADAPAKDNVLFVGTDLSVKQDGQFYHVVGASKNALKIEKDHALEDVRLGSGASIKINKGVKLSSLSATIANVQTESVDRESARAQLAAMQASIMLTEEASMTEDRQQGVVVALGAVASDSTTMGGSITASQLAPARADAMNSFTGALSATDSMTAASSTFLTQNITQGDSAEVELTFDVSSPEPLDHAYLVVVANYGSADKPNEVARQVSAREFAHIDGHPLHVKMSHSASVNGLPFKKFDMALYANGQEVATNLSEKRLALTSEQAHQFFLIDYLGSHRGATLPPAPMLMTPRTEFRRQVENTDANQTIYANVDKMGNLLAMSTDAAGSQKVPASMESVLQNVRFMPALENGAPVEGRLKLKLADLVR